MAELIMGLLAVVSLLLVLTPLVRRAPYEDEEAPQDWPR
jgi:hypothetical protein